MLAKMLWGGRIRSEADSPWRSTIAQPILFTNAVTETFIQKEAARAREASLWLPLRFSVLTA